MSKKKSYTIDLPDNRMLMGELLEHSKVLLPHLITEGVLHDQRAKRMYVALLVVWQILDVMTEVEYEDLKQRYRAKFPPLGKQTKMKI